MKTVKFGDCIKSMRRGLALTTAEKAIVFSKEPTAYRYLEIGNIEDGIINRDSLPYMTGFSGSCEVKDGDLLITKNGPIRKVAVASVYEEEHIAASDNIYIIELDREKIEPYYAMAYFCSEQGKAALEAAATPGRLPYLGVEAIKNIDIPLPDKAAQSRFAAGYCGYMHVIEMTLKKVRYMKAKRDAGYDNYFFPKTKKEG